MAKHNAERMRELLSRKDRRGLTYEELSEETGIPVSTLGYWKRRLREEEGPVFEEVVIEDDVPGGTGIEVIGPRGHRVVVSAEFDEELLRRVLEALPC